MEHLEFDYDGTGEKPARALALAGVVGSGNLEVLIEAADLGGRCAAVVDTSVRGFGETWRQVLADFFARHGLSDVRVSINDGGATPAVVSLRLDQAAAEIKDAQA
ncbi:malonate decarboxylase acyl carrier protein [Chenggangzhangella methanolivorans]|uniref:Malonate decarboxylase acyl carrier protein n=1 Tax=Chenggangzhangella methanolivorans TaxID=1437009 RepID=A0A9E6RAG2_9HYPH|nr:malonate decarboxylase acyl carrier protein [Chenggangzhangella methanolivorans]QZO01154.1 malonate decarboxylase acyl carrier protein [Chenggangzhangella methanolivorans]